MQLYRYVGPREIADRIRPEFAGAAVCAADDIRTWIANSDQELNDGCVTATFVIDADGVLRIADRRSEHVACAGGQPVRSAGEITFHAGRQIEVVSVTNQSTGYCPEPESWPEVAAALGRAGLEAPAAFALTCEFRRCVGCGSIALIKEGVFECAVCGAALPLEYNCQSDR
jgi:hypothetical protein